MPSWIYTIYTQFDQKYMPGRIGSKSIEIDASWIHWDDTQFDQGGIQWISTQFDQYFMPSGIRPVKLGVNPLRLHCLLKAILSQWTYIIYTQFDQKLMPGRIRCKSIEITLPVKGHTISVNLHNLHPIWPEIYARSNSTNQSNWE